MTRDEQIEDQYMQEYLRYKYRTMKIKPMTNDKRMEQSEIDREKEKYQLFKQLNQEEYERKFR